jgi:hypothetical protein
MSLYLYNAAYYWEVVVDGRNPQTGFPIYLEERSMGRRTYLRTVPNRRDLENYLRLVQTDLYLSEEEFESKYEVHLTHDATPDTSAKTPNDADRRPSLDSAPLPTN